MNLLQISLNIFLYSALFLYLFLFGCFLSLNPAFQILVLFPEQFNLILLLLLDLFELFNFLIVILPFQFAYPLLQSHYLFYQFQCVFVPFLIPLCFVFTLLLCSLDFRNRDLHSLVPACVALFSGVGPSSRFQNYLSFREPFDHLVNFATHHR